MTRTLRIAVVSVFAVAACGLTRIDGASPRISIAVLGELPGDTVSEAFGINDRGQIVGWAAGPESDGYHAVLWQHGRIERLAGLEFAFGINDSGQIVGARTIESDGVLLSEVAVWHRGTITNMERLPDTFFSRAYSINERGEVAGYSVTGTDDDPRYHAVVWNAGVITELPTRPGDDYCIAIAINDSGDVGGLCQVGFGDEARDDAVVWHDGRIIVLPSLSDSGWGASAWTMNNRGQLAGYGFVSGLQHAILWNGGSIADLGALPGDTASIASHINDRGQIVGASLVDPPYSPHAVLWNDGNIVQLNTLPGEHSSWATAINESGQIVGYCGNHAVAWETKSSAPRTRPRFPGRNAGPARPQPR